MLVTRSNGWTYNTETNELSWPSENRPPVKLPDVSLGASVYFGLGYLESQASARSVNDHFKKAWLNEKRKTHPDFKAGDVPNDVVPKSDTPEYRSALRDAHLDNFDKLCQGYEVGAREVGASPLDEVREEIARDWLFKVATQLPLRSESKWYVLPPKRRVPRDDDQYNGPQGTTFGEALRVFMSSPAPAAGPLVGKKADGKPWPFKIHKGASISEAITAEAERRLAEKASGGVSLGESEGDADAAF